MKAKAEIRFFEQMGLLALAGTIMVLTNMIGFKYTLVQSLQGYAVLGSIALAGVTISRFMSRFIKLPTMMYVSLAGLLLASPVSPVKEHVISWANNFAFLAPATALGAFAGISLGKDMKNFGRMGVKLIAITVLVITGTFIMSAFEADLVLKYTGSI